MNDVAEFCNVLSERAGLSFKALDEDGHALFRSKDGDIQFFVGAPCGADWTYVRVSIKDVAEDFHGAVNRAVDYVKSCDGVRKEGAQLPMVAV